VIFVSNNLFLKTIFHDDDSWTHVTSFLDDPSDISPDRRMRCWAGGYNCRVALIPDSNQYFCISTFFTDENKKARRRKALFRCTHLIVADDVCEKLPEENVLKLPSPTYKLETSPGSQQWGWVLDIPCTNREQVENLLDGLVEKGLAPDGVDPGMKGVTRYVRLPEGVNTKAKRVSANGNVAPKCRMLEWNSERTTAIDALAEPFDVDINAPRKKSQVDGAADLPDHPLLNLPGIINVKEVLSGGRFDIECPFKSEHTGEIDDGAAMFTNKDGSIGFKCFHGACQHRTGKDLMDFIEERQPGFRATLSQYQVMLEFESMVTPPPDINDKVRSPVDKSQDFDFLGAPVLTPVVVQSPPSDNEQSLFNQLMTIPAASKEAIIVATALLKCIDSYAYALKLEWHNRVRNYMNWTKPDLKSILTEAREQWYKDTLSTGNIEQVLDEVYKNNTYIISLGQFYDSEKDQFLKPELFQNAFSHLNEEVKIDALMNSKCSKVDKIEYAPGLPNKFTKKRTNYINTYIDDTHKGIKGDVTPWLELFEVLGWGGEKRDHIMDFLAYTIQHPEDKINHAIILGGGEGIGKDTLIWPIVTAMGRNATIIQGSDLLLNFNSYLLNTKLLQINEIDAGNYVQAQAVSNKIKGFITAPPDTININEKMVPSFSIQNKVNVIMGTNETRPVIMAMDSRRYYFLWSYLNIHDESGHNVLPRYMRYYKELWAWLKADGWKYCIEALYQRDVSQFDPGATPPTTDDLIDVRESSMDPVLLLFHECIKDKISLFQSDLLTIRDIYSVLTSVNPAQLGVSIKKIPSTNILARILKQAQFVKSFRVYEKRKSQILYCIRGYDKYDRIKNSKQHKSLYQVYTNMINEVRTSHQLKAVS